MQNDNAAVMGDATQQASTNTGTQQAAQAIKDVKAGGGVVVTEVSPGVFHATSPKSKYAIEYDRTKCIGAASCAAIAPLTFFMDDENKAKVKSDVTDWDEDEVILAAAQSCPVFAIRIIDKETNTVIFPLE